MRKLAFIFPGQGAQYVGMGKDLYEVLPAARALFDRANKIVGFDLAKLCFEGPDRELSSTANSQPAILATSIAFLKAIQNKFPKIRASFVLGLSLGEYSALVAAESLAFDDALKLVRSRGIFMEEASRKNPGKMASVLGLDIGAVEEICKESGAEIANLNCPGQIVISGRNEFVEKAIALAGEKGAKRSVILDVSGPFHSSLMDEAAARLKKELEGVFISRPRIPVISNVKAKEESSQDEIKENLINQVNHRTRWEDSIRNLGRQGVGIFLEVGPGKVLKGLLRKIDSDFKVYNIGNVEEMEELGNVVTG